MNTSIARRRTFAIALAAAASIGAAASTAAQTDGAAEVEQVTITADRLTLTAPGEGAARAQASRVPGGAGVVAKADYADGRASTLADAFALAPGVFVQPRFGAEEARLSIRGSGLQRTFHMRGIYLLQDGVPITLADGSGDFQAIEPLALAYTEVLRGANALRYGGSTLGGSINFVSPSGYDGAGVNPRIEVGSHGYGRVFVSTADTFDTGDYFVSVSAYEQEGFRDWSRQKNQRLFGNFALQLRDDVETRFFIAAVNSDSQLPGALTRAQLGADPDQANAGSLAGRQKRDFELYRFANRTVWDLESGSLELSAGYSYKDLWHPIFQVLQQRSDDLNAGIRYLGEVSLAGRQNRLIIGVSPSWNTVADARFVNVGGERGARTAESRQRSKNIAAFAEDQLDLGAKWTLVAGVQWTNAERRYEDRFLANGDQSLDVSYSRLSPKLGFLWRPRETWTLFGNVSDSFEPPSFGELTGGPGVDVLDEQRARTVELGMRGEAEGIQWDLAAYSARLDGELLSLNTPAGQPLGTVNAGRTLHRGLELGAQVRLARSVTWHSAYLWSDFRFDDAASDGDNQLPGIPEHFYRGEVTWTPLASYFVTLNSEWSPDRYPIDMANTWFADAYAIWGLKVGRTAERGLSWFVEGRNLSDRVYAATSGVAADARGLDTAQFYPGDGRSLYAGIAWKTD